MKVAIVVRDAAGSPPAAAPPPRRPATTRSLPARRAQGAGHVGTALGTGLLRAAEREGGGPGFQVAYGVRDVKKYARLEREQPGCSVAPVQDAVSWAEATILAIPGACSAEGVRAAAAALGPGVDGKALLDVTNHLTSDLEMPLLWESGTSGGECLAAALPHAAVFKAFNTTGYENMRAAGAGAGGNTERLTMLMAGPAGAGRAAAEAVVAGAGFAPRRVGDIRWARNLEALAELYIQAAREWKGRSFHIQVVDVPRAER
jgi:predicted dinucleotide-binding enzyme